MPIKKVGMAVGNRMRLWPACALLSFASCASLARGALDQVLDVIPGARTVASAVDTLSGDVADLDPSDREFLEYLLGNVQEAMEAPRSAPATLVRPGQEMRLPFTGPRERQRALRYLEDTERWVLMRRGRNALGQEEWVFKRIGAWTEDELVAEASSPPAAATVASPAEPVRPQ